jgi:hypothetical protein
MMVLSFPWMWNSQLFADTPPGSPIACLKVFRADVANVATPPGQIVERVDAFRHIAIDQASVPAEPLVYSRRVIRPM